ncbi:TPA: hypothetical protein ACRZ3R_004811 [Vibrio harveyi]
MSQLPFNASHLSRISNIHEDVLPLSQLLFNRVNEAKSNYIELDKDDYHAHQRVITLLANEGLITNKHVYPPIYTLILGNEMMIYLLLCFEAKKFQELSREMSNLPSGKTIHIETLKNKLSIDSSFLASAFKTYESYGLGHCGGGVNVNSYRAIA